MIINQIILNEEPLNANKEFLRLMFNEDRFTASNEYAVPRKWINTPSSYQNNMNLDQFIDKINDSNSHVGLQINSPDVGSIRLQFIVRELNFQKYTAGIECEYNETNEKLVFELFKRTYDKKIDLIPVSEDVLAYYEKVKPIYD